MASTPGGEGDGPLQQRLSDVTEVLDQMLVCHQTLQAEHEGMQAAIHNLQQQVAFLMSSPPSPQQATATAAEPTGKADVKGVSRKEAANHGVPATLLLGGFVVLIAAVFWMFEDYSRCFLVLGCSFAVTMHIRPAIEALATRFVR